MPTFQEFHIDSAKKTDQQKSHHTEDVCDSTFVQKKMN